MVSLSEFKYSAYYTSEYFPPLLVAELNTLKESGSSSFSQVPYWALVQVSPGLAP